MLVVHDSHPVDQYLIMLDERGHPAEGGLEGREPIRRFFCNIESHLHKICNPLPLCWEPQSRQGLMDVRHWIYSHRLGSELLPEAPEFVRRRFRNMKSFRGVFVEVSSVAVGRSRPQGLSAKATRPDIATMLPVTVTADANSRGNNSLRFACKHRGGEAQEAPV